MQIKNKWCAAIAGAVFAFAILPATAGAQTVAELQAQIQALLAQIQSLQAQVDSQGGQGAARIGVHNGSVLCIAYPCSQPTIFGANVDLQNDRGRLVGSQTVGEDGYVMFESLPVGTYVATARAKGFSSGRAEFVVNRNQIANVSIGLRQGGSASSVMLTSPNGGETFVQGGRNLISWNGGNGVVQVALVDEGATDFSNPAGSPYRILGWINTDLRPNTTLVWDAQSVCDLGGRSCRSVSPGRYKILVATRDANGNLVLWDSVTNRNPGNWDVSDSYFTITSREQKLTLLTPNGGNQDYPYGSLMSISWTPASIGVGTIQLVNEYPREGEDNVYTIYARKVRDDAVNYSGHYDYVVERFIRPGSYRVRIFDNRDADVTRAVYLDDSDRPFTIGRGGVQGATITSFTATPVNRGNGATVLRWRTSARTDAMLRFECAGSIGAISMYVKEDNKTVNCDDKLGLAMYRDQDRNVLNVQPVGNWEPTRVTFVLSLMNANGDLTGEERRVSVLFPAVTAPPQSRVRLISPNGGEVWRVGQTYPIRWEAGTYSRGTPVQLGLRDVRYSSEIGFGEQTIVNTTNSGSYNFTVPASLGGLSNGPLSGNNYRIVLYVSGGGEGRFDESDRTFTISNDATSAFQILSPNGGESWSVGEGKRLTWSMQGIPSTAYLHLALTDGPTPINIRSISPIGYTTSAEFTVPATGCWSDYCYGLQSGNYKVTATVYDRMPCLGLCPADSPMYQARVLARDSSDGYIRVSTGQPTVTVVSPNGGESWAKGTRQTIRWNTSGVPSGSVMDVVLKKVDGSELDLIFVQRGPNDGVEEVAVPNVSPGQYRIYVRAVNGAQTWEDVSDAPFTIFSPQDDGRALSASILDAVQSLLKKIQGF